MDQALDDKLVKDFPNLYRNRRASMYTTCMCWGFSCENGWYNLIYNLSSKIEAIILTLPEEQRTEVCAAQVKEKYGTLRFYMESVHEDIEKLIGEAEAASAHICEECGANGMIRKGGWIKVLCNQHATDKGYK